MEREFDEVILFRGHPSWRSIGPYWLRGLVFMVVVGALGGIASAFVKGRVQVEWVIAAVLVVFAWRMARGHVRLRRTTYAVTNRRLTIETGLVSKHLHETRLDHVLNVSARQSLLERALDIGTIDFDTAAGADYDFCFRGVEDPRYIVRTVDHALDQRGWG